MALTWANSANLTSPTGENAKSGRAVRAALPP
jgi:hypothetical protein